MSTQISVWGTNGRITADRQECQIFLRESAADLPDAPAGWTVRYTTALTAEVWFYLRGEEYSAQIDYFVQSILRNRTDGENSFRSAIQTDRVVAMILSEAQTSAPVAPAAASAGRSLWSRLFG